VASAGVSPSVAGADIDRDPMTNKYTCSRCGRSYLHQATLVRHQRYECGISASYPCPLCGRKFKVR
jgi:DNA-directed RNA polymerase subunit RPC12/RpoP